LIARQTGFSGRQRDFIRRQIGLEVHGEVGDRALSGFYTTRRNFMLGRPSFAVGNRALKRRGALGDHAPTKRFLVSCFPD
jgi:hypothetical protein